MLRQAVLFQGDDASGRFGLWESNATAAGTHELTGLSGAFSGGIFGTVDIPLFATFNGEVLFDGSDTNGNIDLWVTNGTGAGTTEVGGLDNHGVSGANSDGLNPFYFAVFNGEVLFSGVDTSGNYGLWTTNGTAAGTTEVGGLGDSGVSGANASGLQPENMTVFNSEVLFYGEDRSGKGGLWVTNGTAAGTTEIGGLGDSGVSGANSGGLNPSSMTLLNGKALFLGLDSGGNFGLWVTNATAAGTSELTGIAGLGFGGIGLDFVAFNSEVLFAGKDASGNAGLWVTNGTAAGTHELTGIRSASSGGISPNFMTVFNGEVLFNGVDENGNRDLWVTNGKAAGTSELTGISGAFSGGLLTHIFSAFSVFDGELMFAGEDASGVFGLWVTNGTAAGTHELSGIGGADLSGVAFGAPPLDLSAVLLAVPPPDDFLANNTSDILFINTSSGDTWFEAISNGAPGAPNPWQEIGGSDTTYSVAGTGDFYGTGSSDILFINASSGDTWFEAISSGAFSGWSQIGGSDTHYSVAGVGDFYGTGTSDILFRNTSTGDTWFEAMSNGKFAGWNQIGGSDTNYSVVGVGDFFGSGTDDILFRNNSTGDTWIEQMTNGAFAGWDQIGGSDTHYTVVGVGDFFGNGTDDILFRNNSTGDTWFEAITNGAFAGWHQIGGSDTTYSVAGIGDYFGTNTSDILFLNASTGDTWFEAVSNGAFAGWNHIGGSNTSYSVPVTVGPPALT